MAKELLYTELKNMISSEELGFATTAELAPSSGIIGQERAARALDFGMRMKARGYNIYVAGLPGTGRTTFAKAYAEKRAETRPIPPDLIYIYNFAKPKAPILLTLPAGSGKTFKAEMEELLDRLADELPRVFAAKEFENKKSEILKEYQTKRDKVIKVMTDEARVQNFGVKTTNTGIYFMPIINGEIISEEQYDALTQEEKDGISENSEIMQKRASEIMRELRDYEKQSRSDVEEHEYSVGLFTVGHHLSVLLEKYAEDQRIINYLMTVKEDILENIEDFLDETPDDEEMQALLPWYTRRGTEDAMAKYKINLLVDNSELKGAPVIVDHNPTYANLVGEVEYDNEYGNLTTDFMKIKPGLLHKANGGYLILQAYDVLSNPHAWETLRQVLLTREIIIEPLREFTTGLAMSGVKPEPAPVDVKIILVGSSHYFDLLYYYDDEFQKLFKIYSEFDYDMPCDRPAVMEAARFVKKFVTDEGTKDFDVTAVARLVEHLSRLAERKDKLTTRFNRVMEILNESAAWAEDENSDIITRSHVEKAIREREYRLGMYEEKLSEMIEEGIIMVDTHGAKIGQINGLAILDEGDYVFAKPSRITATTYVGKAGIINIEKEAEMSGNIHEKGVQVLSGYLGQTYAQEFPLSLSSRICFEQNYSGIDGDSASSTELYAVLSSLAELPIRQDIAVTGSINQHGEIQPIGGVTYKIEGFFDLCEKRGLTGKQGVIIPKQNIVDLVLKDKVVEAVKDGMFHIYSISHVDEGVEILTGVTAGQRNEKGKYPADTVHGKVYRKLKDFYKKSIAEE
ncbi:MAG: AAA family ATPase [Clostridiales bacterium]|jgi:lon-related putative ATP-dependent protease|nr:AAA family ATPase [Clostridiales bacterium]